MLAESLMYLAVCIKPDYQSLCRNKDLRPWMTVSYTKLPTLIINIGKIISNCKHQYLSHLFGKYSRLKQSNDYGYKENNHMLSICLAFTLSKI
jgi:hypothetical protein